MRETNDPEIRPAVDYVSERLPNEPILALITGSGLAALADAVEDAVIIPTNEIPGYPHSTVPGHPGHLVGGTIGGVPVLVVQGRVHHYEGYPLHEVAKPTRLVAALGVKGMILTTACGGIGDHLEPGDLMQIRDHINLMGTSPLIAQKWGFDLFPDMSDAYSERLAKVMHRVANEHNIELKEGVFVGMFGPSYETPAEIRYMKMIGADAVSMSTIPEVISAARLKLPVVGVAYISNYAAGISPHPLSHDEVTAMGARVQEKFTKLLLNSIPALAAELNE